MWPFRCIEAKVDIGERMSDMILLLDKQLSKQINDTDQKMFACLDALKCRIDAIEIKLNEGKTE